MSDSGGTTSANETSEAWVTLATNDSYALGALVLGSSLRRVGTTRQLVVMVTPGVTSHMRSVLETVFNHVREVNVLDSEDTVNLAILTRPELGITFTKLHCWRLTEFTKCVFLDADTLVFQNADELFDREEFSAAPDAGWPDCFNSGVFVFRPSIETYERLLAFAMERGSFDGGDQGLLNLFFSDWATSDIKKHLPFIYNMVSSAVYSYLPAYRVFGENVKIAHFIGPVKPWLLVLDSNTGQVQPPSGSEHLQPLLQAWWDLFRSEVHTKLRPEMAGLAGVYATISFEGAKSSEQLENEDRLRKHAWEQGNIDYLGKDSFDNILKKMQQTMGQAAAAATQPPPKEKSPSPPKTQEAVVGPKEPTPPPVVPPPAQEAIIPSPVAAPVAQAPPAAPLQQQVPVDEPLVTKTVAPEPCVCHPPQTAAAATETAPAPLEVLPTPPPVAPETPEVPKPPEPQVQTVPTPTEPPLVDPARPIPPASVPDQSAVKTEPQPQPIEAPEVKSVAAAVPELSAAAPPPTKSAEELEEEKLALDRAAVEKKLAEQKRIAEQKLAEERAAAAAPKQQAPVPPIVPVAAATAAAADTQTPPAVESPPAATPVGETTKPPPPEPKAPPRKAPGKVIRKAIREAGFSFLAYF